MLTLNKLHASGSRDATRNTSMSVKVSSHPKSIYWTIFDNFGVLPSSSNTFWPCPMSEWHPGWDGPTWSNSSVCSVLAFLLVSDIISVTVPKLSQAPSGFFAQSLSPVQVFSQFWNPACKAASPQWDVLHPADMSWRGPCTWSPVAKATYRINQTRAKL